MPPGHRLTVRRDGTVRSTAYWRVPNKRRRPQDRDRARRCGWWRTGLTNSVRDALVADVPVGAYLSGGVDSSLIAALAANERKGAGLHTFAAGFGDSRVDEDVVGARTVPAVVGSTHHEVRATAQDFERSWSKLSWHRTRDRPNLQTSWVTRLRNGRASTSRSFSPAKRATSFSGPPEDIIRRHDPLGRPDFARSHTALPGTVSTGERGTAANPRRALSETNPRRAHAGMVRALHGAGSRAALVGCSAAETAPPPYLDGQRCVESGCSTPMPTAGREPARTR